MWSASGTDANKRCTNDDDNNTRSQNPMQWSHNSLIFAIFVEFLSPSFAGSFYYTFTFTMSVAKLKTTHRQRTKILRRINKIDWFEGSGEINLRKSFERLEPRHLDACIYKVRTFMVDSTIHQSKCSHASPVDIFTIVATIRRQLFRLNFNFSHMIIIIAWLMVSLEYTIFIYWRHS